MTCARTSQPTYTTIYTYTGCGVLSSIYVADGRPLTITFTGVRGSPQTLATWKRVAFGSHKAIVKRLDHRRLGSDGRSEFHHSVGFSNDRNEPETPEPGDPSGRSGDTID